MGKKQQKKDTQSKEMSQKTCLADIEEDESDSDWGHPLNDLCGANNDEDSEKKVVNLEEVIKDQQRKFNEKDSANKALVFRLKRMFDDVYNRSKGYEAGIISLQAYLEDSNKNNEELEAEVISLKADLEKSNKKNARFEAEIVSLKEDLEDSNKKNERLEAEIISLKEDLDKSNKKNAGLEAENISLKVDLKASKKKNEELQQTCEENENWLKEEILNLKDQVEDGRRK